MTTSDNNHDRIEWWQIDDRFDGINYNALGQRLRSTEEWSDSDIANGLDN